MSHANSARVSSPLLILTQALRVSLSPSCLVLATIGLVLSHLIWNVVAFVLPWHEMHESAPVQFSTIDVVATVLDQQLPLTARTMPIDSVIGVPADFIVPFGKLLTTGQSWAATFRQLLKGLLNVAIWGFFGLAIVRVAVVRCGKNEGYSIRQAVTFAYRKWIDIVCAPLATLLAIVMLALPVFAVSWLARFDFGVLLLGLGWIVVLAFAGFMSVLVVGLLFGWPLMWGAIAAEDSDLFDAISRSFAYTYQRPLHYLSYLLLASSLGILGWAMACLASELVVQLAFWSVQVGGGAERTEMLQELVENPSADGQSVRFLTAGAGLIRFSTSLLTELASAFSYSFFWSTWGAIYLLLRFDNDQTLEDDIIVDRDESDSKTVLDPAQP